MAGAAWCWPGSVWPVVATTSAPPVTGWDCQLTPPSTSLFSVGLTLAPLLLTSQSYIAVQPRLLRSGLTRPEEEPGQTVLECEVSGQPRPGLVWTRGLNTINISQRINIHALEVGGQVWRHSLNILQLREEDYGNYSCLATNKVGSAR